MREQNLILTSPSSRVADASDTGEHLCQMFDLIAARAGRAHAAAARQQEEQRPRSVEVQLKITQGALARAHESIAEIGLQLEAERRARQHAEAKSRVQQHACEEAMQLLDEAVQPLRELKNTAAEYRERAQQQARAYADLEAARDAIDNQLRETEAALAGALELAERMKVQVETESQARNGAETKAEDERHRREEAMRALVNAQNAAVELRSLVDERTQAYAELETRHAALQSRAQEDHASLERSTELTEQLKLQLDTERRAREDADARAYADRLACEQAEHALICLENATAERSRSHDDFLPQRQALEARLKDAENAVARAEYAAYRHAQRHAQMTSMLEKERRARAAAEAGLRKERRGREAAEDALRERNESTGFWKSLLKSDA